jgi:hypothetical protein
MTHDSSQSRIHEAGEVWGSLRLSNRYSTRGWNDISKVRSRRQYTHTVHICKVNKVTALVSDKFISEG